MGFKDIGEIASRALQKTLEDPEQQKNLMNTLVGFVSLPDRSDTSDSAFDLGRFRQFNIEKEQEKANRALQAKLRREKEAADLKFRRDAQLKLADLKGKAALRQLTEDRADERARLTRESKKEKGPDLFKLGREYHLGVMDSTKHSFYADFEMHKGLSEDGLNNVTGFIPSRYYYKQLQEMDHPFAKSSREELVNNPTFQNFTKDIRNKHVDAEEKRRADLQKSKGSNRSKTQEARMGGALTNTMLQYEVVPQRTFMTASDVAQYKNSTELVQANNGLYLKGVSDSFVNLFKSDNFANNKALLNQLQINDTRYNKIRGLYGQVMEHSKINGFTSNNGPLKELAKELSSIIDVTGEADFVNAAIRENIKEVVVQSPDGTSQMISPNNSRSKITTTDYGFLISNPIMRAIAIEKGFVKADEINDIAKRTKTEVTNENSNQSTIIYNQFPDNRQAGDFLSNIVVSAKRVKASPVVENAIKRVRSEQYTSSVLIEEVDKIHKEFLNKGIENINKYDLISFLSAQRVKVSGSTQKGNMITREYYALQGLPMRNEKTGELTKQFQKIVQKDRSLADLRSHSRRILNLSNLDADTFGGGTQAGREATFAGTASDVRQLFTNFKNTATEVFNQFGIRDYEDVGDRFVSTRDSYNTFKVTDFSSLTPEQKLNAQRMQRLENLAVNAQTNLDTAYNKTGKTPTDYNTYIKKSVILWEKTALTYKLAGIVQGDSTGGRTISDQDFSTIYSSLWGGTIAPEAVTGAALTNLFKTTQETIEKREAERILMLTTGSDFTDPTLGQMAENIYQRNMKDFYDARPGLEEALVNNKKNQVEVDTQTSVQQVRASYDGLLAKGKVDITDAEIATVLDMSKKIGITSNKNLLIPRDERTIALLRPIVDEKAKDTELSSKIESFALYLNFVNTNLDKLNLSNPDLELYKRGILDNFADLNNNIKRMQRQFVLYKNTVDEAKKDGVSDEQIMRIQNNFPVSVFDQFRIVQ